MEHELAMRAHGDYPQSPLSFRYSFVRDGDRIATLKSPSSDQPPSGAGYRGAGRGGCSGNVHRKRQVAVEEQRRGPGARLSA